MNVQCAYLITDVQQSPASHDEEGKKIEQVKKICGVPADGYLDGTISNFITVKFRPGRRFLTPSI